MIQQCVFLIMHWGKDFAWEIKGPWYATERAVKSRDTVLDILVAYNFEMHEISFFMTRTRIWLMT